jgi:hypothetical protein
MKGMIGSLESIGTFYGVTGSSQMADFVERALIPPDKKVKSDLNIPDIKLPAISTIHAVLDRNGLVESKLRRKTHTSIQPMHLSNPILPNGLWCAD